MHDDDLPEALQALSPWRSGMALALDWAGIGLCFAAAIYFAQPAVYVVAAILIARTQLALAVLVHEAAHGLVARRRSVNDVVGQLFAAGPLFLSLFSYRQGHLQHHRAPMAEDDPVAIVFGIGDYPVSRRELAWRLLKDVTGIGYVLTLRDLLRARQRVGPGVMKRRPNPAETALVAGSVLSTNAALFAGFAAVGHPWLYVGLWLVPALTFLQLFARLRAITEHAGYPPGEDQTRNARSIVKRNWQTFFCGPHSVHFHIEHHRYVRAPFYRLQRIHRHLRARNVLPTANLYRGYGQVLRDVTLSNHPT